MIKIVDGIGLSVVVDVDDKMKIDFIYGKWMKLILIRYIIFDGRWKWCFGNVRKL